MGSVKGIPSSIISVAVLSVAGPIYKIEVGRRE